MSNDVSVRTSKGIIRGIEIIIFNVRWLLIPFYLGLLVVLTYYGLAYFRELLHFAIESSNANIDEVKLFALDTIDIVMVGNLIKMIITGSYNSFVNKKHGYENENVSSGELKIKITTSIVVLSVVHLLKQFMTITSHNMSFETLIKQIIIFGMFLLAALVLSLIESTHAKNH